MPNWCHNQLTVKGNEEDIKRFNEKHFVKVKNGVGERFSFNTIVPMPEILVDTNGFVNPRAFLGFLMVYFSNKIENLTLGKFADTVEETANSFYGNPEHDYFYYLLKSNDLRLTTSKDGVKLPRALKPLVEDEQVMEDFRIIFGDASPYDVPLSQIITAIRNGNLKLSEVDIVDGDNLNRVYQATGYLNWWEWSIDNWGTKWDTDPNYSTSVDGNKKCVILTFDTAWSPPEAAIISLAKLYPNLTIELLSFEPGMFFAAELKAKGDEFTYKVYSDEIDRLTEIVQKMGLESYLDEDELN